MLRSILTSLISIALLLHCYCMVIDTMTPGPLPGVGCGVGEANAKSLGPGQLGGGIGTAWNRLGQVGTGWDRLVPTSFDFKCYTKVFLKHLTFLHQTLVLDIGRAVHCSMN